MSVTQSQGSDSNVYHIELIPISEDSLEPLQENVEWLTAAEDADSEDDV